MRCHSGAAGSITPGIRVVARAHSDEAVAHLEERGGDAVFMGERKVARREAKPFTALVTAADAP